ncbi:hypothetical protein Tco_0442619 [Tanacetum coccineum]
MSEYQNIKSKAFVGGSWSDSDEDEEEKTKDTKRCLMAKCYNDGLKVMAKNKTLKQAKIELENDVLELKDELSRLEKVKELNEECKLFQDLKFENEKLRK